MKTTPRDVKIIVSGLDKLQKTMEFQNQHGMAIEIQDLMAKIKTESKWTAEDEKKIIR
jgi:hypothetical protein